MTMHLSQGQGFNVASHPMSLLVVFVALLITGSGKYSLAEILSIPLMK